MQDGAVLGDVDLLALEHRLAPLGTPHSSASATSRRRLSSVDSITAENFGVRLANTGEGSFLRTGDLGFLHDGRVVVTGRLKDLVIVRGKKHYPQDLELSAETSHPAFRPGGCAVFAMEGSDGDGVVIVAEVEPRWWPRDGQARLADGGPGDPDGAIAAVRQALSEEHQLQAHAIVLIAAGGLARTTSGKLQRHACRAAWEAGALPVVAAWARAGDPAASQPLQEVG